ncbi:MAG: hypothetical protein MUP21_05185 [Dehalococcoidia bacterium]|nr:hypothetical protein [Dehalococcoidia bacterium]
MEKKMDLGQDLNVRRTAKAELKEIMKNLQGPIRAGLMDPPRMRVAHEIINMRASPRPWYKSTETEARKLLPALRKLEHVSDQFIKDWPRRSHELLMLNFRRKTFVLETAMKAGGIGLISWPFDGGSDDGMIRQPIFYRECEKGSPAAESFRLGKKTFFGTAAPWPCETLNWEYFRIDDNLEIENQITEKRIKLEVCLWDVLEVVIDRFLGRGWGTGDYSIDGRIFLSAGMFFFESESRYTEYDGNERGKKKRSRNKYTLDPYAPLDP